MENLTLEEALKILNENRITDSAQVLRRWLREGKIRGTKEANQRSSWRIAKDDLNKFINKHPSSSKRKPKWDFTAFSVEELFNETPVMMPLYQRTIFWSLYESSAYIHTLLKYGQSFSCLTFAQDDSDNLILIDGKQRFWSIYKYLSNEFILADELDMIEGYSVSCKKYEELDLEFKKKLWESMVNLLILKHFPESELKKIQRFLNTHPVFPTPGTIIETIEGAKNFTPAFRGGRHAGKPPLSRQDNQ